VDALLDGSSADRKQVGDAVNAVTTCASASAVTDARQKLSEAADHRDALVGRLDGLSVELVDGGAAAVAELRTAWQYSADADRAFANWAASAEGCTTSGDVSRTGDYDRGVESSTQATKAKNTFIEQWNPIATGYGLSSRSEDQI
jgi:aminopeptidase N